MGDWIAFWDSDHAIYVNGRHRDVHYRRIAEDVLRYVAPGTTVLDFGCGEALHADLIAETASRLILVDAAPRIRAGLAGRFDGRSNVEVRAPEELPRFADRSIDLIVLHSVAQYLSTAQLNALLLLFRRLLRPDGLLIVGDVIPPNVTALTDILALFHFAATNGFFFAAMTGLVRTVLSDYRRLRATLGLTRYSQAAMEARLEAAGFTTTRGRRNIGHNPARMTFLARPA
jgi:SAM-dependent methyltransferase